MRRQRGSVFIMALVAIVILAAVLATAVADTRVVQRSQLHRIDEKRAERMAYAGIEFAVAQMLEVQTSLVTLDDDWAIIGEYGDEALYVGNGYFRVEVIDAGSKIDLNTITQEQLELLPLTTDQIDALLDWRESDLQPRIEGAKDEYYNTLYNPYNTKLRSFDLISELLLVAGFDALTVYEPMENTVGTTLSTSATDELPPLADLLTVDSRSNNLTPLGETKMNVNTASENQMIQGGLTTQLADAITDRRRDEGTFSSWTELLQVQGVTLQNVDSLLDNLTLDTNDSMPGKVNLNTATEETLNLLPGFTPDVTEALLARQGTFESLGDIAGVPGLSIALLGQIAAMVTVSSESFIVRVIGGYGLATVAYQAVVTMEELGPRVQKIEKSLFFDQSDRWGWGLEASFETILIEN